METFFFFHVYFILCLRHGLWKHILQVEAIKKTLPKLPLCQEHFANISVVIWSPAEVNGTLDKHEEANLGKTAWEVPD